MRTGSAIAARTLNKLVVERKPTENKIKFRTCGEHEKVHSRQMMMIAKRDSVAMRRRRVSRISVNGIEMPLSFDDTIPKGSRDPFARRFIFNANVLFHTQFPFNLRRLSVKKHGATNTHTRPHRTVVLFAFERDIINLIKYYGRHSL